MIFQVFLALSLATVVLGDGCCAPDQWEGYEMAAGGYTAKSGRKGAIHNGFKVSYDAKGQKIAVSGYKKRREDSDSSEEAGEKFKVIYDFQAQKAYFIVTAREKCKAFDLKKKFRKACIPDDAKKVGSSYLGAGKNTLPVTAYSMVFRGKRANVRGVAAVTDGCVPVSENWWGEYMGAGFFENVNFAGITAGIEDPSVFSPPEFCDKVVVDVLEEEYEQFSALRVSFPNMVNI